MPNATLKIDMVLTTSDGLEKRIGGDFDFGTDDEAAIDQYWANLKGTAMGSEAQERETRAKGKEGAPGQVKKK